MDETRSSWVAPVVVIIGIILVVLAFVFYKPSNNSGNPTLAELLPAAEGANINAFRPVDSTDKIRGSALAPIKVVVYTDLECPACKYFHQQLTTLNDTYVTTGKVAIVYRNFPLDTLHSKARNEAMAAECVNEIGGNDKYWQFIDKIFEITPSNNNLDPTLLASTAKDLGVSSSDFATCLSSQKYASSIQKSVDEATALGANGTPFFVVVGPNDVLIPVFGGLPAERMAAAFSLMLGENAPITATTTAPVATTTAQ